MIMVDANIMIDILGVDQDWQPWSRRTIRALSIAGEDLVINTIVLAEIAGNAPDLSSLIMVLTDLDLEILTLDSDSAFIAGQAYRSHRRHREGHSRDRMVLADFLIGAYSHGLGASLLTRDPPLYRRYFPALPLITPETHP